MATNNRTFKNLSQVSQQLTEAKLKRFSTPFHTSASQKVNCRRRRRCCRSRLRNVAPAKVEQRLNSSFTFEIRFKRSRKKLYFYWL